MTIKDSLKAAVRKHGGSAAGIKDIKDGVKAFGETSGGSGSTGDLIKINEYELVTVSNSIEDWEDEGNVM